MSIFVSCLLDKSFLYNYNAALSAKIERRKVNIMKQRKRFRKGIITFMLLIVLVTVQVVQVTALASEEGQTVQVSTWDDLLAAVIASQEGDVIEVMDEITIPSGIALNPSGRITIKRGTADASLRIAWNSDTSVKNTFENIDFDGGEISSLNTMIELNSSADFTNCSVKNCFTNSSAVTISNGEASFNGCTFSQNKGNSGSHIGIQTNSKVTIQNCTFTGGQSGNIGGAIHMVLDNCDVEITGSTITGNSASTVGGGIYNRGTLVVTSSKIYGNTAEKGADIYSAVPMTIETQVTDLEAIYADENISVHGWLTETNEINEIFMKLDYENNPEPSEPDNGDNTGDQGQDAGSSDDSGNTDHSTPSDSSGDQGDSSGTGGNGDLGNTGQPGTGSDSSDQGSSGAGDNTSTNNSNNSITDSSSNNSTTSTNANTTSTDSSQTTTNSGNTTTDNRRTESSDNHSSTTYNYYQTEQTPVQQPQMQSEQAKEPVIINNYIQPSEQGQTASQGQQVDIPASEPEQQAIPAPDPSNNIRIDAKGADVVFEVKDGVYSISINASEPVQDASASVPESKSSVNWYEIIKIVLLAALVVNMLWKPRKETTKY